MELVLGARHVTGNITEERQVETTPETTMADEREKESIVKEAPNFEDKITPFDEDESSPEPDYGLGHEFNMDKINWAALNEELQNLFIKKRDRTWTARTKFFFTALVVGLLPTLVDIGTDGLSMFYYIHGNTYLKFVPDPNHPSVNCTSADEHCVWCKNVGRHLKITANTTEVDYEEFECFEQDPIWGYMTLTIIFLPGVVMGFMFANQYSCITFCKKCSCSGWLRLLLIPIYFLSFPVLVLFGKMVGMFNPGPHWTSFTGQLTRMEAKWESKLQFLLQLFIVFTRADRRPSTLQMASMFASLLIFTKVDVERHCQRAKMGVKEIVILLIRLYADHTCFSLGGAALIALLRYWLPAITLTLWLGIPLAYFALVLVLIVVIVIPGSLVYCLYKRGCSKCCRGNSEKGKMVDGKKVDESGEVEERIALQEEKVFLAGDEKLTNIGQEGGGGMEKVAEEESSDKEGEDSLLKTQVSDARKKDEDVSEGSDTIEVVIVVNEMEERLASGEEEGEKNSLSVETSNSDAFESDDFWFVVYNIFQTILLIVSTITANFVPDLELPGVYWEGHKLSELAIVENIYILNSVCAVVLLTGVIQVSLYCVQNKEYLGTRKEECTTCFTSCCSCNWVKTMPMLEIWKRRLAGDQGAHFEHSLNSDSVATKKGGPS